MAATGKRHAKPREHVGAVDVVLHRRAQELAGDFHANAIGVNRVGIGKHLSILLIAIRNIDAVGVDKANLRRFFSAELFLNVPDSLGHADVVDPRAH